MSRITVVAVAVSRVHRERGRARAAEEENWRTAAGTCERAIEEKGGEGGGRKGKKKPQNVSLSASARIESRNSASKVGGRSNLSPNKFQPLDCGE